MQARGTCSTASVRVLSDGRWKASALAIVCSSQALPTAAEAAAGRRCSSSPSTWGAQQVVALQKNSSRREVPQAVMQRCTQTASTTSRQANQESLSSASMTSLQTNQESSGGASSCATHIWRHTIFVGDALPFVGVPPWGDTPGCHMCHHHHHHITHSSHSISAIGHMCKSVQVCAYGVSSSLSNLSLAPGVSTLALHGDAVGQLTKDGTGLCACFHMTCFISTWATG
ncbi:hypothetical protein COO60DRAFT_713431 [Scenedesmus sp. NREL 46B-D3]|nr:hypothetical protein COO60DRAFT_713431 [Scenedesmus sp. NREL 46B-D3]